jgi:hypothetical protein
MEDLGTGRKRRRIEGKTREASPSQQTGCFSADEDEQTTIIGRIRCEKSIVALTLLVRRAFEVPCVYILSGMRAGCTLNEADEESKEITLQL